MLYEFRKGSTTTEAYNNICQTEGPEVVSYSTIKFWYRKFSSGEEDLSDQPRSGRPTTVDKDELKLAISTCSTSATRQLAADLGSSKSTIARNLWVRPYQQKRRWNSPWTNACSKGTPSSGMLRSSRTARSGYASFTNCNLWWKVDIPRQQKKGKTLGSAWASAYSNAST